jgi:hypothetical protein
MDANQEIQKKPTHQTVHLIGELKIPERNPRIVCVSVDYRELAGNRLRNLGSFRPVLYHGSAGRRLCSRARERRVRGPIASA